MNLSDRYQGLPFSRGEVDQIGAMLNLCDHEAACSAAGFIAGALDFYRMQDDARRLVPDVKVARRRLDRIATTAQHLARLLSEEPLASRLAVKPGWASQADSNGSIDMEGIFGNAERRVEGLKIELQVISANAARLSDNDRDLRASYLLPKAGEAGRATPALSLWPRLFELWEHAGKRVAGTAGGPLHRFLKFVHQAAGLFEPNPNTFKDAVAEWKYGGFQAKYAGLPPWWTEEPD